MSIDIELKDKLFRKSIAAGIMISLGGTAYLTLLDNKIIASLMFSLALLAICACGLNLFTGKVYRTRLSIGGVASILTILVGNAIGTMIMGTIISRIKPDLIEVARQICIKKMYDDQNLIWAAVLCNVLVFFAVESFKKGHWEITVLAVMAFVLCGFEHSIANMFYFSLARMNSTEATWYIVRNVIFNAIGGIGIAWLA